MSLLLDRHGILDDLDLHRAGPCSQREIMDVQVPAVLRKAALLGSRDGKTADARYRYESLQNNVSHMSPHEKAHD